MRTAIAALLGALAAAPALADGRISARGALDVRLGMTLAEARAAEPSADWAFEPRYMVDFSADCARRDGRELFCALIPEADAFAPDEAILAIVVTSPDLSTAAGVRVGAPIRRVELVWGEATFAFSWANEGREFVSFANAPKGLAVRAASPSLGADAMHVGLYSQETADREFQQTRVYRSDAVVDSIWIN